MSPSWALQRTSDAAMALCECKIPLLRSGAIGGLNGLLAGMAPLYDLRGFCLLATSSGADPVDIRAANNLLCAINELLHLDIDITLMEPVIEVPEVVGDARSGHELR